MTVSTAGPLNHLKVHEPKLRRPAAVGHKDLTGASLSPSTPLAGTQPPVRYSNVSSVIVWEQLLAVDFGSGGLGTWDWPWEGRQCRDSRCDRRVFVYS